MAYEEAVMFYCFDVVGGWDDWLRKIRSSLISDIDA